MVPAGSPSPRGAHPVSLLTYKEAAVILKVHSKTVSRWLRGCKGLVRINHQSVRIPEEVLEKFIQDRTRKPKK